MNVEAVEVCLKWESPLRIWRFYQERWIFHVAGGCRRASTSYKDRNVTGWWFNPWALIRVLGLELGIGLAVSRPSAELIKIKKEMTT